MIKTSISGVNEFIEYIKDLPRGVKVVAMRAITEYVIGNQRRGLKHYPRYKHVTRKAAYGKTFVSDKQRRYVMAKIRSGEITPGYPERTGRYQRGWVQNPKTSDWRRVNVENAVPHAQWLGGSNQARLNAKVGWRKAVAIVMTNINGAIRDGQKAVDEWIAKKG